MGGSKGWKNNPPTPPFLKFYSYTIQHHLSLAPWVCTQTSLLCRIWLPVGKKKFFVFFFVLTAVSRQLDNRHTPHHTLTLAPHQLSPESGALVVRGGFCSGGFFLVAVGGLYLPPRKEDSGPIDLTKENMFRVRKEGGGGGGGWWDGQRKKWCGLFCFVLCDKPYRADAKNFFFVFLEFIPKGWWCKGGVVCVCGCKARNHWRNVQIKIW